MRMDGVVETSESCNLQARLEMCVERMAAATTPTTRMMMELTVVESTK